MSVSGGYLQLGLVTNDFERALELLRATHAIASFKEMRELTIGARGDSSVTAHFALAFKGETQFEIIQPLDGDCDFYTECLPPDGFALRLHHLGQYCPTPAEYEAARVAASRWPIIVDHAIFDGGYCYVDARAEIGLYREFYCFPAETHFEGVPCY
jgi:hypothetical protein